MSCRYSYKLSSEILHDFQCNISFELDFNFGKMKLKIQISYFKLRQTSWWAIKENNFVELNYFTFVPFGALMITIQASNDHLALFTLNHHAKLQIPVIVKYRVTEV